MHLPRQHRRGTWAPKALAIVSFALAMLAMQPMVDGAAVDSRQPAIVKEVSGSKAAEPRLSATNSAPSQRSWRVAETVPASTRLHILATVEILQRLLISELHVQPAKVYGGYLPTFDQVCIQVLPPATTIRLSRPIRFDVSPPPAERTFAITHFLLAPPIV